MQQSLYKNTNCVCVCVMTRCGDTISYTVKKGD